MRCTIHQPTFLPYLGFFRKVALADTLVIYDTAQYTKNDWHNRNRVKTKRGVEWLTVPVSSHLGDDFRVAKPSGTTFIERHLGKLREAYSRSPYFLEFFPKIEVAYKSPFDSLGEINFQLLDVCLGELSLTPEIRFTHDMDLQGTKGVDALIEICEIVDADTYIGGIDTEKYVDISKFGERGIKIMINDFESSPYPQQWGDEFVPNLSVVDAIFNIGGEETRKLIV